MSIIGSDWEDELVEHMKRTRPERERRYKSYKKAVNALIEELNNINQKYDATASPYNQREYLRCLKRGGFDGFDFNPLPKPKPTSEKNHDLDAIIKLRNNYEHLIEQSTEESLLGSVSLIRDAASNFLDKELTEDFDSLETRINYTLRIVKKTKTINVF
ncbi:hypothetical protein J4414_02685 [Candidatus Woesearchaeota archaeon]|nr:hypothetical protein [Candidatus Woesearchaeota archaeon]